MNTQDFLAMLEKELGLIPGSVKAEDNFRNTKYWDSLAEIALLSLIEDTLEIKITPTQLKQLSTVQELLNWIDSNSTR